MMGERNGIVITPIRLAKRRNPTINLELMKKITFGSRKEDNSVLSQLTAGTVTFEDLI